jgi:hypothetical protein
MVREGPEIPNRERSIETEGRVVTGKSDCIEANITSILKWENESISRQRQ